ncbi:hypothetical protein [Pseudoalteromonas sp. MMG013]|uniref:hypothetical protein n=1 Tax=Pseudoalteromonas sp. MMG013 TaxID=2822687 RepID=UPI001FFD23F4|nr:hypothetical protein [Pseudoalteromonas sp. MMG013]
MLKKVTVETALNAEMDEHLGYAKHHPSKSTNSLNGMIYSRHPLVLRPKTKAV